MGNYALLTGATKGIGLEMAKLLAARGIHLVLVARNEQELNEVKIELNTQYSVNIHCLAIDLSKDIPTSIIGTYITNHQLNVTILINNAGNGLYGYFDELSLDAQHQMIQLNIMAVVDLCHYFIPIFKQKKEPTYILNTGSTTAFQAIPTFALYAASKSFVHSFTRALYHELKATSTISVTLLSPGATRTNFINRANLQHIEAKADKFSMDAVDVAKQGIDGMFAKKMEVITGAINQLNVFATRVVPRTIIEKSAFGIYAKKK